MHSHKTVAQHYFLDALDLHHRFSNHWNNEQRVSSRIKSFIDLLMACECMLKSQCIVARDADPLSNAYKHVKSLGHSIKKLSQDAEATFPSSAHLEARKYFGQFPVGLRYSVDAYHFFFPIIGEPSKRHPKYHETLGNSLWIKGAEETVKSLIGWGKERFNGEVEFDVESIILSEMEVSQAITVKDIQT